DDRDSDPENAGADRVRRPGRVRARRASPGTHPHRHQGASRLRPREGVRADAPRAARRPSSLRRAPARRGERKARRSQGGDEGAPVARQRLRVREETTDGFRIAEEDLRLRGPGEFIGTRQSGMPDFAVAELTRDQDIAEEARDEAFALVKEDPELRSPENAAVRELLLHRWKGRLSLARVG